MRSRLAPLFSAMSGILAFVFASSASALPNLLPYQPTGWTDKIIVSKTTGTNSDSVGLTTSDSLYVDWAVANLGTMATSVRFYIELYVDGTFKNSWFIDPPMNANTYSSLTDYSLGPLSAGTHTLRIKMDAQSNVSESSESDNEYTKTITVSGTGQPNLTPYQPTGWSDKIVVSKTTGTNTDGTGLTTADSLYVDWAVANLGTSATASRFFVELYVDGSLKTNWFVDPPMNANTYSSLTDYSLGSLSAGTHTLRIKMDAQGNVSEGSESDNEYTKTITVNGTGQPNLTPYQPTGWSDKIVVSKTTGTNTDGTGLTTADSLYVDWAVANLGTSATASRFFVELYVDGSLRTNWFVDPPMNANTYSSLTDYSLGSLSAGTHTLRIKMDAQGNVSESSESDNEYTKTITVSGTGKPNLLPYQPTGWSDKIVVSKTTGTNTDGTGLTTADSLYVDWAVANLGTSATASRFFVELYVDGSLRTNWFVDPPMNANTYSSLTDYSLGSLSAGTHTLRIKMDAQGNVSEGSESDNEYTKTITVSGTGKPNLVPYQPTGWSDKIVVSKTTGTNTDGTGLTTADSLYVDWAVANLGTAATASRFFVELYVDGSLKTNWFVDPPMNANTYSSLTDYSLGSLSAGTHTLRIKMDAQGNVSEGSESDNEYTKTITVGGGGDMPNLTPYLPSGWSDMIVVSKKTGTHSDGTDLTSTDSLYVDWAVINAGRVATGVRFYTALYLDGVLKTSWSKNSPLSSNHYTTIEDYELGKLSSGTHTLRIKADSTGTVAEANEQDNEYIKTITIMAAPRSVFVGIFGGGISDVPDDPDGEVDIWRNEDILPYIKTGVAFCKTHVCLPRNDAHLAKIASSELGGIVSLGFFMTSSPGVSSLNTPGNSEIPKTYIVDNYSPGDRVYVVGFSVGGGDAQNVLEKLNDLGIPVGVSGHIDSVEIGDDASIPSNTAVAQGYYQTQSSLIVRGEDKLIADNPDSTSVTNTKITDPVGPANPKTDNYAYHRNMDNDTRVWGGIKAAIIASSQKAEERTTEGGVGSLAVCARCQGTNSPLSLADWTAVLKTALEEHRSGEELYYIRDQMAWTVNDATTFQELLAEHDTARANRKLQENLTAVVLKVKPKGFLTDMEQAASATSDYSLFVAIAHSLAGVETVEAEKLLLQLVKENRLDVAPGRVIDAIVGANSGRRVAGKDAGWMLEWVNTGTLSDYQMYAIARVMANAKSDSAVRDLLGEIEKRIQDERLKAKLSANP